MGKPSTHFSDYKINNKKKLNSKLREINFKKIFVYLRIFFLGQIYYLECSFFLERGNIFYFVTWVKQPFFFFFFFGSPWWCLKTGEWTLLSIHSLISIVSTQNCFFYQSYYSQFSMRQGKINKHEEKRCYKLNY